MEVYSEKTFYEINVTEAFRTVDADVILWGEDRHATATIPVHSIPDLRSSDSSTR